MAAAGRAPIVVETISVLASDADAVWAHAMTPRGINSELMPLVRMALPDGLDLFAVGPDDFGRPLRACWMLAFGVIPFDRHVLGLEGVGARWFQEDSHSLIHRRWRHYREVIPGDGYAVLLDRVEATPRLRALAGLAGPIVSAIFSHRHDKLRARWGTVEPARVSACIAAARGRTLAQGESDSPGTDGAGT